MASWGLWLSVEVLFDVNMREYWAKQLCGDVTKTWGQSIGEEGRMGLIPIVVNEHPGEVLYLGILPPWG